MTPESSPIVRSALAPYVERGEIAGVVSVLSDADYNESWDCLGWADAENKVPMRPDTVFAVFSMTKTLTGCAIMIAVDRGILKMDDPVEKYLPEFRKLENKVTIRDCMCHITGVGGWNVSTVHTSVPLREQARAWALNSSCRRKIGEEFVYGNNSIATAAACLEVASGMPYERFLAENVLEPLGMKDTTFTPDEDMLRRLSKAYTTEGGAFRPAADRCSEQLKFPVGHKVYPMPSAGLYSTPADMIRFSQMLAHHGEWKGRTIVSRRTFDEIWAVKQTPANIAQPYTVGSWLYGDWFGHEGAMRTDQRANLKTGHSRVFFIQTENKAGKAFFDAKADWHRACDLVQKMDTPFSEDLVRTHENDRTSRRRKD
jgi:CubicO group peptidase (beta-lactamase class C family)